MVPIFVHAHISRARSMLSILETAQDMDTVTRNTTRISRMPL